MKVCLVKLPTIQAVKSLSYFGAVPSLGLAYIAAAVREERHDVHVIDAVGEAVEKFFSYSSSIGPLRGHGLSPEEIADRVPVDTDVLGISNLFLHEWEILRDTIMAIKQKHPKVKIVLGGENPTGWWPHMMQNCEQIDFCILGEGEESFCDLLRAIQKGSSLADVGSLVFRRGGELIKTPTRPRIRNIDELPLPAWDLFPVRAYLDHNLSSGVDRGRSLPILSSRGCPYRCKFCSSPNMWTTKYIAREPKIVVDEIELYMRKYQVTNINFNDLTAILTKDWIVQFCKTVIERDLKFTFQLPSGTRSEAIDQEAAEYLFRAGCRNFCYAPESGSKRVLKYVNKKAKLDQILKSLRSAVKVGIATQANIVIGFPSESVTDLAATFVYLMKLAWHGCHGISVMVFSPYPGSEFYEQLVREDKIDFTKGHYLYSSLIRAGKPLNSFNDRHGLGFYMMIQWFFLISFFGTQYLLRPWRVFEVLRNLVFRNQHTLMDQFLGTKVRQLSALFSR
jgi:anaerobic magnesium-protoporphyrin IX monomethyl ester cyclase